MRNIIRAYGGWYGCANDYDCKPWNRLSDADKNALRRGFDIPRSEDILFMRDTGFWNNKDQGLVMTNRGLHVIVDNDSPEDKFIIEWKEFDRVVYQELVFYFFSGDKQVASLHYDYLLKCEDNEVPSKQKEVCNMLNSMAALVNPDIDPIAEANEGRFDVALAEAEHQLNENPESVQCLFALGRVIYLEQSKVQEINESRVDQAIDSFRKAISLTEDTDSLKVLNNNIAFCEELKNNNWGARYAYMNALEYAQEREDREMILNEIRGRELQLKDTWDHYTEVFDYQDRKFCMPVRDSDIGGCVAPGVDVFMMSNIPSQFKFPVGHPYPNQLYIGHPYKKELYVPYEESEEMFFMDKVHELCYLLECLGAESIEITSIKGKNISEMNMSTEHLSGSVDFGFTEAEGEKRNTTKSTQDSSRRTSRSYTIKLDPMRSPYLPDGLIWYPEQPQWQRLVDRRLNNNILEYTENVQSSETRFTTGSEMNEIRGNVEYLWNKIGGAASKNAETQFKSSVDTVWGISVKFRSMKDFDTSNIAAQGKNIPTDNLTAEEQEYLDEVNFCLEEDGLISAKEERLLDRLRLRLGLSEQRASEIREMALPLLTEDEKEYINEVKECLSYDGEITAKEERLLDRLRQRLNISAERAVQLKSLAIK